MRFFPITEIRVSIEGPFPLRVLWRIVIIEFWASNQILSRCPRVGFDGHIFRNYHPATYEKKQLSTQQSRRAPLKSRGKSLSSRSAVRGTLTQNKTLYLLGNRQNLTRNTDIS